jgi:nucleotide-binding universal stress UspA family protein
MYKKILVPLDGSELAECSLEHVNAIASGCNVSKVILIRVLEPISGVSELAARMPDEWLKNVEKEHKASIKAYLTRVATKLKRDNINVQTVVVEGNAADSILEYTIKNDIDLIVMSTHGRSGLARWAFGSVADRVVLYSHIPVLIISPHAFRVNG